jgi:hypothetical protein
MLTVHNFSIWDNLAGRRIRSVYKCSFERIKKIGGEVIPNTAEEVDESHVDKDGVYVPLGLRSMMGGCG